MFCYYKLIERYRKHLKTIYVFVQKVQNSIACVADTLNLLYTNGLDEYVGRLQRRLEFNSLNSSLPV